MTAATLDPPLAPLVPENSFEDVIQGYYQPDYIRPDIEIAEQWNSDYAEEVGFSVGAVLVPSAVITNQIVELARNRITRNSEFGEYKSNQVQLTILQGGAWLTKIYRAELESQGMDQLPELVATESVKRYVGTQGKEDVTLEDAIANLQETEKAWGDSFEGKDVEIVEDLIDKGITLDLTIRALFYLGAKTISLTTLARKIGTDLVGINKDQLFEFVDKSGWIREERLKVFTNLFAVPGMWLAGTGMDCGVEEDEVDIEINDDINMRNLPFIAYAWKHNEDLADLSDIPEDWRVTLAA